MTLSAGARGIDFAYNPTGHTTLDGQYAQIAQDGAQFVCRYSAGIITASKVTQPGEPDTAARHGVDFFANFEGAESTPLSGASGGRENGARDREFWESVGLAPGAGVIISLEPGNSSSAWPALSAFLEAYRAATGRPVGLYAGLASLLEMRRRGLIECTWLPMASSVSGIDTDGMSQHQYAATMQQVAHDNGITLCQNRNRWYGTGADEDIYVTALRSPFSHLQAIAAAGNTSSASTQSSPTSKEFDVFVQFHDAPSSLGRQAIYLVSGGYLIHVKPGEPAAFGNPAVAQLSVSSNFYRLPIAPGSDDPRST